MHTPMETLPAQVRAVTEALRKMVDNQGVFNTKTLCVVQEIRQILQALQSELESYGRGVQKDGNNFSIKVDEAYRRIQQVEVAVGALHPQAHVEQGGSQELTHRALNSAQEPLKEIEGVLQDSATERSLWQVHFDSLK